MEHEIRQDLIACALAIRDEGKTLTRDTYMAWPLRKFSKDTVIRVFKTFAIAIQAAGIDEKTERPRIERPKKFVYQKPRIDTLAPSNTVRLGFDTVFARAGNPEFIKAIVMPDLHVEHADPYALNCFLEYVHWRNPDLFICLGDFLNAGGLSHWGPDDLSPQRIVPEALKGREILGLINGLLPAHAEKWFLEGNHEDWIRQFLISGKNPQLFDGLAELGYDLTTKGLLGLDALGFKFAPMNQILRVGLAAFVHGLYAGNNHAKSHVDRVKSTIFYGHTHDRKLWVDTGINGPVIAQSLACLCDLRPKFLRGLLNNWEHGFGDFTFFRDGTFTHTVPMITNGRAVIDGKIFRA